jgi:Branched-chain amino acid transport system / permease component
MLDQGARLYWAIQRRRNEGLGALFLVLAAFAVIYAILFPGILTVGAMAKFVQGWFPTAMVAAAETIVMLTGGIDLSVGPMVSLGSVVAASTMQEPLGIFGGVLALFALGTGVGVIVGAFVAIGRYPAIIVTLALSFVLRGIALLIMPRPGGFVPTSLSEFLAGSHPTAAVLVVLLVILSKLYQATPLGIGLIAVGDNAEGAYRSGQRHHRAHERLYHQRESSGLHRPLCRGPDRLGRSLDRRTADALSHRRCGAWGGRVSGRSGRHARGARGQPAHEHPDQRHVLHGSAFGGAIRRSGMIIVVTVALPLIRASLRRPS